MTSFVPMPPDSINPAEAHGANILSGVVNRSVDNAYKLNKPSPPAVRDTTRIPLVNSTCWHLRRGEIVEITEPLNLPTLRVPTDTAPYIARTPTTRNARIVVVEHIVLGCSAGVGIISGRAQALVDVKDTSHKWARAVAGSRILESTDDPSAPAEIVWVDGGLGIKLAEVLLSTRHDNETTTTEEAPPSVEQPQPQPGDPPVDLQGPTCSGIAKWVWDEYSCEWYLVSDTCGGPPTTTTSEDTTTTPDPSITTTTPDPSITTTTPDTTTTCQCYWYDARGKEIITTTTEPGTTTTSEDTTTTEPGTTTTSGTTTTTLEPTTTTTPEECQPLYPTFCGSVDGECTYTFCATTVNEPPECTCGTTTTGDTTTTEEGTTTTCDCDIHVPPDGCTAGCDWVGVPTSGGGWRWVKTRDGCFGDVSNNITCPCSPPTTDPYCAAASTPCVIIPPPVIPPIACTGGCTWWWLPALGQWHLPADSYCSWHGFNPGYGWCGCHDTPSQHGDECAPYFVPCTLIPIATTTTSEYIDPCVYICAGVDPPTTTPDSTTTTSEADCGHAGCKFKSNAMADGWLGPFEDNCPQECPCVAPTRDPYDDCEVVVGMCVGDPPTTTTPEACGEGVSLWSCDGNYTWYALGDECIGTCPPGQNCNPTITALCEDVAYETEGGCNCQSATTTTQEPTTTTQEPTTTTCDTYTCEEAMNQEGGVTGCPPSGGGTPGWCYYVRSGALAVQCADNCGPGKCCPEPTTNVDCGVCFTRQCVDCTTTTGDITTTTVEPTTTTPEPTTTTTVEPTTTTDDGYYCYSQIVGAECGNAEHYGWDWVCTQYPPEQNTVCAGPFDSVAECETYGCPVTSTTAAPTTTTTGEPTTTTTPGFWCCLDSQCVNVTSSASECINLGGDWYGTDKAGCLAVCEATTTTGEPTTTTTAEVGWCCTQGACLSGQTQSQCDEVNGVWYATSSECTTNCVPTTTTPGGTATTPGGTATTPGGATTTTQ